MNTWIGWWQQLTIFPKLVMSFLVIILPVFIISFGMNQMGANSVREEIGRSMSTSAGQYLHWIATDINRAIRQQREYINNADLTNLAIKSPVMTDVDRTAAILQLQQQLREFKNNNVFLEDIRLYIPGIARSLTANDGSVHMIDEEQFEGMKAFSNRLDAPIFLWEEGLYISIAYPDSLSSVEGVEPLFVLALELSQTALKDALSRFSLNQNGGAALVSPGKGWMVTGFDDTSAFPDLHTFVAQSEADSGAGGRLQTVRSEGARYMVAWERDATLGLGIVAYTKESELLAPLRSYRVGFWILCAISIFAVTSFSYWIYKLIHQPLRKLVFAFRRLEQGNLKMMMPLDHHDEFGYLYRQFNGMVSELERLIQEVYEKNYRLQASEYRQLQAQINPHFLYNSFFVITRMAKLHEMDNVVRLTKHLGEYFQFITRDGADIVTLREELSHARNYVEIQSIRFYNRIRVAFDDIPSEAAAVAVPRLIVQPIIENVFQHGLRHKLEDGELRVVIHSENSAMTVTVEDNGADLSDETIDQLNARMKVVELQTEMTGLFNVHRRLQIKHGPTGGLRFDRSPLGGLRVRLTIPKQGGENHAEPDGR